MPGLWERSCVKRDRQSAECGPSRARRSGGFFVARSLLNERFPGVTPERETRIPGLARENARAQARGACRRERGDEPDTDGRANSDGVRNWRRICAAERLQLNPVCRLFAAQPTLVVKISDTSSPR